MLLNSICSYRHPFESNLCFLTHNHNTMALAKNNRIETKQNENCAMSTKINTQWKKQSPIFNFGQSVVAHLQHAFNNIYECLCVCVCRLGAGHSCAGIVPISPEGTIFGALPAFCLCSSSLFVRMFFMLSNTMWDGCCLVEASIWMCESMHYSGRWSHHSVKETIADNWNTPDMETCFIAANNWSLRGRQRNMPGPYQQQLIWFETHTLFEYLWWGAFRWKRA